jgi:hypothetical protein
MKYDSNVLGRRHEARWENVHDLGFVSVHTCLHVGIHAFTNVQSTLEGENKRTQLNTLFLC